MASLISFVQAHSALVSGAVVALVDLAFAINPNLKSNGILHFILNQLGPKSPAA